MLGPALFGSRLQLVLSLLHLSSLLHISLSLLELVGSLGHVFPLEKQKVRGQVPSDRRISSLCLLHSCQHPNRQFKGIWLDPASMGQENTFCPQLEKD